MYILIITLYSTIGVYHPITLKGDPPPVYASYGECQGAGEQVQNWLTQDFMRVQYECKEIKHETAR